MNLRKSPFHCRDPAARLTCWLPGATSSDRLRNADPGDLVAIVVVHAFPEKLGIPKG